MIRPIELTFTVRFAAAIFVWLGSFSPLLACRYNVRDVGFVDLGRSNYQLELPGAEISEIDLLRSKFPAGNVHFATEQPDTSRTDQKALLRTPENRTLELGDAPPSGWTATELHNKSVSELSQKIVDQLIDCHSIILLVECEDAAANQFAREKAESAIEEVVATKSLWPKPIANPPEIVAIGSSDRIRERLLLESLGIQQESETPQAAILFGRGRRLGPVLTYSDLQAGKLPRQLSVISIDCECDFNVAAMIGPMIPHAWSSKHEARASKSLQFDPGMPLVQVEVEQILARWPREPNSTNQLPSFGDPLLGYQEILLPSGDEEIVSDQPDPDEVAPEFVQKKPPTHHSARIDTVATNSATSSDATIAAWKPIVWTLAGLLIASILASGLLWLRQRT